MTIITSKSNNLIKKTKKLLKKKYRDHSYLIEGWHLFEEAEKAAALLESGADPWYGDEVTSVEVDPESVEREILHTDRSRLHRMQGPERSGRAR